MGIKQRSKSLKSRSNDLNDTFYQLEVLSSTAKQDENFISFKDKINEHGYNEIKPVYPETFQINIGKLCNQTCAHCHVDAGPDRKEENMDREMLQKCLDIIRKYNFKSVDITGGAPEMNPHFRWFVEELYSSGVEVMDRCNLTIIEANKKYYDLPDFFAKNKVHVVSSLPYYSKSRTDAQRGDGVFNDSIAALQRLNRAGYGKEGTGLKLDLVYNPSGAFLPGEQVTLENEFKRQLKRKFDIEFNNLLVITNLPISRFLEYLIESGNYEDYMQSLLEAFNPSVIDGLMCRNTLSISWDGYIYDCDFNQMLDMKVEGNSTHIDNFDMDELMARKIKINNHCYGCTAGSGSSCGGEIG